MVEVPGSSPVAPTNLRFVRLRLASLDLFFVGDCLRFAGGAFEDAFAH